MNDDENEKAVYQYKIERKVVERVRKWARPLAVFALILPLVFFTWQITIHIHQDQNYEPWRVSITGFDPRDILKGQFVRFRYDWDEYDAKPSDCDDFKHDCCLCLTGVSSKPQIDAMACDTAVNQSCAGILAVDVKRNRFDFGLREYYVDERAGRTLDMILRRGEILLAVDLLLKPRSNSGDPRLTTQAKLGELYLNGRSLSAMLDDGSLPIDNK